MSTETFIRGLVTTIISLVFAWVVFSRYDSEVGAENSSSDHQRYLPYVPAMLLPLVILTILVLGLCEFGVQYTSSWVLSMLFGIFLHISVYYVVLLFLLPFLRKHISARACAMLWMIPNYLYLTQQTAMKIQRPLWVIRASERIIWFLFGLWATGFILVLGWKVIAHLIFRRSILKGSEVICDPAVLDVLQREIENANFKKPKFKPVYSAHVVSPLSVGLFRRSVRIVLPYREFSREELQLIFRHELIHIGREDAWSKFFLLFCTAMCWFNPCMWIAMRKSEEDMELSCDETVLLDCDESTKRQYAELILKTAGDDRGFTTCLSASASTMKYRLNAIIKPPKRHSGALIVGAIFFALCMSCGYVALAYGEHTGSEAIFANQEPALFTLDEISVEGGKYQPECDFIDVSAINEYLANLTMVNITGNFTFSEENRLMQLRYTGPDGIFWVQLHDSYVKVSPLQGERVVYYLPETVDWAYLDTIVPELPVVEVNLYDEGYLRVIALEPTITKLTRLTNDSAQVLKSKELQYGERCGIYGASPIVAEFRFSLPLLSDVEFLIESWDYASSCGETLSLQDDTFKLALPQYSAHYTIHATFQGQAEADYEAEFHFDIGDRD